LNQLIALLALLLFINFLFILFSYLISFTFIYSIFYLHLIQTSIYIFHLTAFLLITFSLDFIAIFIFIQSGIFRSQILIALFFYLIIFIYIIINF